jgi:hypothetical protein
LFIVGIRDTEHLRDRAARPVPAFATAVGWLIVVVVWPGGFAVGVGNIRNNLVDFIARRHGLDPAVEWDTEAGGGDHEFPHGDRPSCSPAAVGCARRRILRATGITKRYGGLHAVDSVDIEVRRRDPASSARTAGKTTLFELLSGFTTRAREPQNSVGRDVTRLSPSGRANSASSGRSKTRRCSPPSVCSTA